MEEVIPVFRKYDINGDNKIDVEEFRAVLVDLGVDAASIDELFRAADQDKDKYLDVNEFCTWVFGHEETMYSNYIQQTICKTEGAFSLRSYSSARSVSGTYKFQPGSNEVYVGHARIGNWSCRPASSGPLPDGRGGSVPIPSVTVV